MRQTFYNSYWKPKAFGSSKAKYECISVPCLPNTGLTSGRRLYIVGATVNQVKKCFVGYKRIKMDAFGRVEIIYTPNGSGPSGCLYAEKDGSFRRRYPRLGRHGLSQIKDLPINAQIFSY